MDVKIKKGDFFFLFLCAGLAIIAELAFFHGEIGVSYLVFITAFYWVFFWRFKSFPFTNRRIGFLILIAVWMLAASYLFYSNMFFYLLNLIIIPSLVILHLTLITGTTKLAYDRFSFILYTIKKVAASFLYNASFVSKFKKHFQNKSDKKAYQLFSKVFIGILLSVPLLFIVISLLSSADAQFGSLIGRLPFVLNGPNLAEAVFRFVVIVFFTFAFFGFLQVLNKHNEQKEPSASIPETINKNWDGVITATLLVMVNIVYGLFVTVQFQYFFSGSLQETYTFAEYARRGFFELLLVSLINLTLLNGVLTFTKMEKPGIKMFIRLLLTILVLVSSIMLVSAFMRLSLYESAYGFTLLRVLPHSFMILLGVIFAYTMIKIWVEKLSLARFYIISALVYYALLNTVNIDQFIVDRNMDRYRETGKIDVYHLDSLSYTGLMGLMDLYEINPEIPNLKQALIDRKTFLSGGDMPWQSFNLSKREAYDRLQDLEIK
ncbi:DUF4173 domain-containing protein [Bacillus sp. M6-12]|uniref:DUF4153 domain-containing protein n=1 Tax=Bacillus sp. M6-12 TaxID=2054166 RepID=UPI000C76E72D|nr:DUF4173 domain-containing protein [Bacillus sp. M6-12]PLS16155.1 DUF4173 domain-containing protein [Bacillus sp. M6-12]